MDLRVRVWSLVTALQRSEILVGEIFKKTEKNMLLRIF